MMIYTVHGNIFDSTAQVLVNPVNTRGVMGKGLARQFKERYPANYRAYVQACRTGECSIGKVYPCFLENVIIVNFPTKADWRAPSKLEYIAKGLKSLKTWIEASNIRSIAIPPLGCGLGGLDWREVKRLIVWMLGSLPINIYLYEPKEEI